MKKMKKKQKLMCKIIACKLKNEFIQTLHSKQLHEAGDWQSEIVEKPTRTKRICSIFLFLESLLIFISNGLLKPRSTGWRGIVFFFRILDMKYYNSNSKFLVQRSSKMGPSIQKYMNFDDFMSETLILQF